MRQAWRFMTKYKKGTVVLVLFPNSDLVTAKRRPAVVVQSDDLDTGIDQVIVAMITSNMNRARYPSRIRIDNVSEEGKAAGILTDSVVMTDNLATVKFNEIDKILGIFPLREALDKALRVTFGL